MVSAAPMPTQRSTLTNTSMIVGAIIAEQLGAATAATVFDDVGAYGMVFLRLGFAAVILWAVGRPRLRGRSRHAWVITASFGALTALLILASFAAVDRLPLGLVVTIELLGPLGLATVMSRRAREFAWTGVALLGVVLLGETGDGIDTLGIVWALVGALAWAGYIVLGAETGRRSENLDSLALALTVSAVLTAPLGIVGAGSALLEPRVLAIGAGVALLSSVVSVALSVAALREVSARTYGVLMSLSPAIASLAGFVVLDQRLTAVQLVAIALVIVASAATVSSTTPVSASDTTSTA